MANTRAWLSLCLALASVSMLTASCGSDEAVGGDDAGQGGLGDAGDSGTIIRGGAGAGGTGGSGGAATGGTGGTTANRLGQECLSDDDCGTTTACLPPSSGVPHGLCTRDCTTDADCPSNGVCLTDFGICLEGCSPGASGITAKCHGRANMACQTLARAQGTPCDDNTDCGTGEICDSAGECRELIDVCWASCGGDFHCEEGSACDFALGLCLPEDEVPEGDPIGSECDPDAAQNSCDGFCLSYIDENQEPILSTCTAGCTFGYLEGCGWDATGPAPAACLLPNDDNGGLGDTGICTQLCDCNADCGHPEFACFGFADIGLADFEDVFGRLGFCNPATDADGEPITDQTGDPLPQLETCEDGAGGAGNEGEGGAGGAPTEPGEEGGAGGAAGAPGGGDAGAPAGEGGASAGSGGAGGSAD